MATGEGTGTRSEVELSVVVPAFDERDSLRDLAGEVLAVGAQHELDLELVIVDDGSTDGSWQVIESLAAEHPEVSGVRLRRNFGKAAALSAGISVARGRLICTLDGDGQDDPAELPKLLEAAAKGADVVTGWKHPRRDPLSKRLPSRVFNALVGMTTQLKLHDHNTGFKLYRAEVFREIELYGELHRFATVLAHARGFSVVEVPVHHRPRAHGRSKYGASRFFKGVFDLITVKLLTGYGSRPHHPLGLFGLVFFALGLLGMTYLGATWVARLWVPEAFPPLSDRPLLVYSVAAFLFGAQMMSMGFIAALVSARGDASGTTRFSVAQTIGPSAEREPALHLVAGRQPR